MTTPRTPAELDADDVQEFASNMSKYSETLQNIWHYYLETRDVDINANTLDPLNMGQAFAQLANEMMAQPGEVMDASMKYWNNQMAIWSAAANKIWGSADVPDNIPNLPEGGKRFAHPQWSENAIYEYVKRSYLLNAQWAQDIVAQTDKSMDTRDKRKVEFATRNMIEALNPANFATLNPEVLEATVAQNGANLVRGAEMMFEDMRRGGGDLMIRQTDMDGFKVGENMAVTPGKIIFENRIFQLIQYTPSTETVHETPLLFFPPWINKYYVLDLNERKSMMKWLVAQGHTVFVVSWVNPDERHGGETWQTYIEDGALVAIDKVLEETGAKSVNLASYCIGGTLTGTLMAKLSRAKDKRVKSTTFFTAQLDFEDAGDLQAFVDSETLRAVDAQSAKGYLPAKAMAQAFNLLRSNDMIWTYVVNNYLLGKDPFPFDLLYWNSDSTCMPAKVHHYYLEQFYLENQFAKDGIEIGDENYTIKDVRGPVYHIATVEDHIAPASSVYRGAKMMERADVTFVLGGSGHIAGVVNPPDLGKYQFWTSDDLSADDLEAWREGATSQAGSWWPHWDDWLASHSKKRVKARTPGKVLGVIEDAPGRYVKERADER
jgi:polyhydroxyalkanoate synthase